MTRGARDGGEIEALVTDRYLESLLALRVGLSSHQDVAGLPAQRLPPEIRRAAAQLRHDLPRFHPSFRFEERLAQRLADVAARLRLPAVAGGEASVFPFAPGSTGLDPDGDPLLEYLFDGPLDERQDRVRPFLIGGAVTSAALSLAGAAYVAWRRTRPATTPMARAVRAIARGRPA